MHIRLWRKNRRIALFWAAVVASVAGALFVFVSHSPTVVEIRQPAPVPEAVAQRKQVDASGGIQLARDEKLTAGSVVALVDGEAIHASEILEIFAKPISQLEGKVSPAEIEREKRKLVQRDLPTHIDAKLLVAELRRELTREQLDQVDKQLEEGFAESLRRFGADTPAKLEQMLQDRCGYGVVTLRAHWRSNAMATAYLREKISKAGPRLTAAQREALRETVVAELRAKAEIKTIFQDDRL